MFIRTFLTSFILISLITPQSSRGSCKTLFPPMDSLQSIRTEFRGILDQLFSESGVLVLDLNQVDPLWWVRLRQWAAEQIRNLDSSKWTVVGEESFGFVRIKDPDALKNRFVVGVISQLKASGIGEFRLGFFAGEILRVWKVKEPSSTFPVYRAIIRTKDAEEKVELSRGEPLRVRIFKTHVR